jgi:hypothetical protein
MLLSGYPEIGNLGALLASPLCGELRFPRQSRGGSGGGFSAIWGRLIGILGAHNPIYPVPIPVTRSHLFVDLCVRSSAVLNQIRCPLAGGKPVH